MLLVVSSILIFLSFFLTLTSTTTRQHISFPRSSLISHIATDIHKALRFMVHLARATSDREKMVLNKKIRQKENMFENATKK